MSILSQGAQLVSSLRSCMTGYQFVDDKGCTVSFRTAGVYNTLPDLIAGLRSDPRRLVAVHISPRPRYSDNYQKKVMVATVPAWQLATALSC